jgi:hypothetical protein
MSDRTNLPSNEETNPSHGKLFITVSPPMDFRPELNFQVPSRWSFVALNPMGNHWLTAQGRQNATRYTLIKYNAPPAEVRFFEVASIPVSQLGDVRARVLSVFPEEHPQGEDEFNRQYVRDILKNLVDGGIICEDQATDALLAVEASAQLQLEAS